MKMITKQELVKLAKMQDPEPELYKMAYGDILAIKEKIETAIRIEKDDRLFSILMKLKSHVMVCEDWIRYTEVRKIEKLSSLDEIVSYIEKTEQLGKVIICV
jgi:hypothetical protein